MEKLQKSLDILRSSSSSVTGTGTSSTTAGSSSPFGFANIGGIEGGRLRNKDASVIAKEKIAACHQVGHSLTSFILKQNSDFGKHFSTGVEQLFLVCDDNNADVRLVAEQCLNSIFRHFLNEGNATRVHVELYRELKRNGSARCARAALGRFADLAPLIRPNKSRLFAISLVPCLTALARRPEEALQDALGATVPRILAVLGSFLSDEECKILVKGVLPSLQLQSVVSRRCAAAILGAICLHCRKRHRFTSYVFRACKDLVVPVAVDQSSSQILGALSTFRCLMSSVKHCCDEPSAGAELRLSDRGGSSTIRVADSVDDTIPIEHLLQLYEVALHHVCNPNSVIVTAALELLSELLTNCPASLLQRLTDEAGVEQSRIYGRGTLGRTSLTGGKLSGFSSLTGSVSDLPSLTVTELANSADSEALFPGIPASSTSDNADDRTVDISSPVPSESNDLLGINIVVQENGQGLEEQSTVADSGGGYSGLSMGVLIDNSESTETENRDAVFSDPLLNPIEIAQQDGEAEEEYTMSRGASSAALSPTTGDFEFFFPSSIGTFVDTGSSLLYACRLVANRFLLAGRAGELLADKDVRVSHKCLALGVLTVLIKLRLELLQQPLLKDDECSQRLSDCFLFESHPDPQLRGVLASLSAGVAAECSRRLSADDTEDVLLSSQFDACMTVLGRLIDDDSAIVLRNVVASCQQFIPGLLESRRFWAPAVVFLWKVLKLADNTYWRLKVSLAGFLSKINFSLLRLAEQHVDNTHQLQRLCLQFYLTRLVTDSDIRVRQASCNNIPRLLENLCFVHDCELNDFLLRRTSNEALPTGCGHYRLWSLDGYDPVHCLATPYFARRIPGAYRDCIEGTLGTFLGMIYERLTVSANLETTCGLLGCLSLLADKYPPTVYRHAWLIDRGEGRFGVVCLLVGYLTSSPVSTVITTYRHVLDLLGSLFCGYAEQQLEGQPAIAKDGQLRKYGDAPVGVWPLLNSAELSAAATDLLLHCIKILNVYWHVVTETPVAQSSSAAVPNSSLSKQISSLPQPPSLSPVRQRIQRLGTGVKDTMLPSSSSSPVVSSSVNASGNNQSRNLKFGDFSNQPTLMRLYEILKGTYSNYKTNVDSLSTSRFVGVLASACALLGRLLEVATVSDVGHYAEEMLTYCRATIDILPQNTVECVIQLLKALFGTNLHLVVGSQAENEATSSVASPSKGLFEQCLLSDAAEFSQSVTAFDNAKAIDAAVKRHMGWLSGRADRHMVALFKSAAAKTTLTNYIRLFEPIVVQSLKLYTSSVGIQLQRAVLALLSQLVQVRVNYTLLDTDFRFLNFLYQQLENVEQGNFRGAELLVPTLFEFLLLLSYEKANDRQIVEMPKVLQLCDSIFASGQDVVTIVMPVLHLVVLDLYYIRPSAKVYPPKEIQMQQEVIASMLLKYLQYPQAADLLIFVTNKLRLENEAKWRKLSRDIVDRILGDVVKGQISLSSWDAFRPYASILRLLCPSVYRPVDQLIGALHSVQMNTDTDDSNHRMKKALASVICIWPLLTLCSEDAVLNRLSDLSSQQSLTTESAPAKVLANYLRSVLLELADECVSDRQHANNGKAVQFLRWFLHLLSNFAQKGQFPNVCGALKNELNNESEIVGKLILGLPVVNVQYVTLHNALSAFESALWNVALNSESTLIRRLSMLLYSDQLLRWLDSNEHMLLLQFLRSHINTLVDLSQELPLLQFIKKLILTDTIGSFFVELILEMMGCIDKTNIELKSLKLLVHADVRDSGLIVRLLTPLLRTKTPSVARQCAQLFCLKLEELLLNRTDEIKQLLPEHDVVAMQLLFDRQLRIRFRRLYSLLCKLGQSWYGLDPASIDDRSPNDSSTLSLPTVHPSKFSRLKWTKLVQDAVRIGGHFSNRVLAVMIVRCSLEESSEILACPDVAPGLLYECLKEALAPTDAFSADDDKADATTTTVRRRLPFGRFVLGSVQTPLFALLRHVVATDTDVSYVYLLSLCRPLNLFLLCVRLKQLSLTLVDVDANCLLKFCLLLLERSKQSEVTMTSAAMVFKCLSVITNSQAVWQYLTEETDSAVQFQTAYVRLSLSFLTQVFKDKNSALVGQQTTQLPFDLPAETPRETAFRFTTLWRSIQSMLLWLEETSKCGVREAMPRKVQLFARHFVIACARLPAVNRVGVRLPPSAFKYGWVPEVRLEEEEYGGIGADRRLLLPSVPVHQLQNPDVLRQFVWRLANTGWTSKVVFEEIWMALLGVLSATPIGKELEKDSPQAIQERVLSSTIAVRCLTSLLVQSLLSPQPGNPLHCRYVMKPRAKNLPFLGTTNGRRLAGVCRSLQRAFDESQRMSSLSSLCRDEQHWWTCNLERTSTGDRDWWGCWQFGQFSVDSLWASTGILATERSLVAPLRTENERLTEEAEEVLEEQETVVGQMPKSTSAFMLTTSNSLDLVSCMHFLLDLYSHWLREGCDAVPVALLSTTVESMLALSDLFTEVGQYQWMRAQLKQIYTARASEDEVLFQFVLLGLMKCCAILGLDDSQSSGTSSGEAEKELRELLEAGSQSPQLSTRLVTIHGVLYLLQSLGAEESTLLMPLLVEFVLTELDAILTLNADGSVPLLPVRPHCLAYQLALCSVGFYIAECCHDQYSRQNFLPRFLEQCGRVFWHPGLSWTLVRAVSRGLESLLTTPTAVADPTQRERIRRLATACLQKTPTPRHTLVALQLLFASIYSAGGFAAGTGDGSSNDQSPEGEWMSPSEAVVSVSQPDSQLSAMEQLTYLFSKLSGGSRLEALAVGATLPVFLRVNFNPGDVMHRVVSEMLAASQVRPAALMAAIYSLFDALRRREAATVVNDWALLSIPAFTHKSPTDVARATLAVFAAAASYSVAIRALFPLLLDRMDQSEKLDSDLFCFLLSNLKHQFEEEPSQIESLRLSLRDAAVRHDGSAFALVSEQLFPTDVFS